MVKLNRDVAHADLHTAEAGAEVDDLLARLRVELVALRAAKCNAKVTINLSAGGSGTMEITKFVKFD
ncbi:MAG: hypothetical protein WBO55_06935 [Rhizobiaceae bacterium]